MDTTPKSRKRRRVNKSPTIGEKSLAYFGEKRTKNDNDTYECKFCKKEINGNKLYNLSSHLHTCHKEIFFQINKKKKDPVEVKRLKLLQNAVQIVSVDGKPFNFLLASGYQAGIENKLRKLKEAGHPVDLSQKAESDVKKHLHEMAKKARKKICESVRDREVSAMIDIVTKNSRSILGVSVQFLIGAQLKVISLGLIELEKAHTGLYLAEVTRECFAKYGIKLRKVITMTRDNGANVVKMVRDMHNDLQNYIAVENMESTQSSIQNNSLVLNENDDIDHEILELLNNAEEITDEDALSNLFENVINAENQEILDDIATQIPRNSEVVYYDITGMNYMNTHGEF